MKLLVKLFVLTLFIIFSVQPAQAKNKKQYFNQVEFEIDFNITHPIVTGNFLEQTNNEILIMGESNDDEKIAVIYAFNEEKKTYTATLRFKIPLKTLAFDYFNDKQGIKKLVLLSVNELAIFDFNKNKLSKLATVSSIYLKENPQFIAKKKLVEDFDGDGLDDIYVSDFSKINLFIQQDGGSFKSRQLLIKPEVDMSRQQISFTEIKIFHTDVNFDQLLDVVIVENGNIQYFEQLISGEFGAIRKELILPMNVSKLSQRLVRGADGDREDQSDSKHRMIEKIEDLNGDNIADLMLFETKSSGVFEKENSYEVYYGFNQDNILAFKSDADTMITSDETLSGIKLTDINGNGKKEAIISSFDIGVSQIIGAILSGSIDQNVNVFSLNDENHYSKKPLFSEEVDLSFSLSSGSSGEPVVLSADLNGSGFKELILSSGEKKLAIYKGIDSDSLFNDSEKKYRFLLPKEGSMMLASDLNNDKKQELIVHYGKQDKKELRNTIIILSAK